MSSIDNNLGGGGGSASASGKKGAIQLSDGNFNLTSNKELKSDPKTGTITTTGLTTTGTVYAATISTSNLIADTITDLTVIGDASITGNAIVDGFVQATDFIGSGDALTDLNASNVTFGTLSNAHLPGTISVSKLEASSNLYVSGPADITGTLSSANFIGSGDGINNLNASNVTSGTLSNDHLPGTISVSNLEATTNLVVGGPANITGTLSAANFIGSGDGINNLNASNVTSGTLSNDHLPSTISVSNLEATANLVVGGPADIAGTLSASSITTTDLLINGTLTTGNVETTNVIATHMIQGATISSTGQVIATGSLTGASATVTGQVQGATVSSTGSIIATSTVTGSHINTPTLVVSKDAQINGNLYVSGGFVTITSTTTGTNQINITNDGTGPALVVKQTGDESIVNFLDGDESVFFISGGELTDKDGFVGLGTTTPQERLDVQGNIVSSGTISSTNVATSNLTVTNSHEVIGTLSASNVDTSNLTVSNRLSGGTISVSNIEATANLVVGGPADITGTLSAADFIGSGDGINDLNASNVTSGTLNNDRLPGTISVSNIEATANLVVGGPANITGTLSAAGITSSAQISVTESGTSASITLVPRAGSNGDDALRIYRDDGILRSSLQYNGDADFRTITVSNIQGGSPLTIGAGADTINIQSNMIMVDGSTLTAGTLYYTTLTTEDGVTANINAFDVMASNSLISSGDVFITSNLGIGTTDTAEYKLLVKNGSSNLFGVPYNTTGLAEGKTIVYDGSGWVYDNAGPADGTQTGEILAWDGSEWSANSAVVVEGTNVGIGSTQPVEKLNVSGNVRVTQNMIIGDSYHGRAMRLNDTPASNLYYQPNLTITGSLTSAGDIKTNQSFRGHTMFLSNAMTISGGVVTNTGTGDASVNGSLTVQGNAVLNGTTSATQLNVAGTITTSNITHGSKITVTSDLLMGPGATLTASNIVGASPVTISSNLVMAQGFTLTAASIEPPSGVESNLNVTGTITASNIETSNLIVSNRLSGGTISVSNIEATANLVVGGPVDITGTLSVGNTITSTSTIKITGGYMQIKYA